MLTRLYVMGMLILLLGGIGYVIYSRQADPERNPVAAAREFFDEINENRAYDAYRATTMWSDGVRFESFERRLRAYGLSQAQDFKMLGGRIEGFESVIEASYLISGKEKRTPLTLRMALREGKWMIYDIDPEMEKLAVADEKDKHSGGSANENLPDSREAAALASEVMRSFAEAVDLKFFGLFHREISQFWQKQTTPAKLEAEFRRFITADEPLREIVSGPPKIMEVKMDEKDILRVQASFQRKDRMLEALMHFVKESGEWKLFGLHVRLLGTGQKNEASAIN